MKILVTGATGFIGQYVIRNLLEKQGVCILATTRNLSKANKLDYFKKVEFIEIDLSVERKLIFQELGSPDIMIHLAWDGLPNYSELFHIEKNLIEHKKFIFNMLNSGLKDISVTGTCFEYGRINGGLQENMIANPSNPYGIAKNSLREFIESLQTNLDFSFKWLRLFYTFGKGQGHHSLFSQLENALASNSKEFNMSGGEQIRDYLPIKQMADYIVECSLQKKIEGIINCCSGRPISVKNLIQNYIQNNGYDIKLNLGALPYSDCEPMGFWGDTRRINKVLKNAKK